MSTDVIDSTKKGNTIPRNICGRIWDMFIVVMSYLYINPSKWFLSSILIKLTFSLNKPINSFLYLFIYSLGNNLWLPTMWLALCLLPSIQRWILIEEHKTLWWFEDILMRSFLNKIDNTVRQTHILELLKNTIILDCIGTFPP